ncbi:GerAB/ArcD/ProY family transporter [Gordoniibacillus kamchatkensis]|uniref:GerAB/ArcD/ProY family transporter n=1 Tax=Gordoniibacillus kamchatkensis TaxID=1590651 RepID=UPI00069913FD|nr:GerAB/ArcD/ProY family transporter [Paenibacillus sp. VKM B-2647]
MMNKESGKWEKQAEMEAGGNSLRMIGRTHLMMLVILSAGLMDHVILIPILLDVAGRDSWLSVLFAAGPAVCLAAVIGFVMKRIGSSRLQHYLARRSHAAIAWAIMALLGLYVVSIAAITIKETMDWLEMAYLPSTPKGFISFVFIVLCVITADQGARVIAVVGGMLLPLVAVLGYFVMTANLPHKQYKLLFPVLENGFAPVVAGGVYIIAGFAELILLLLLTNRYRTNQSLRKRYFAGQSFPLREHSLSGVDVKLRVRDTGKYKLRF